MTDPLILTARFDPESFARFNAMRREHFPPGLNQIPAHLTLFHKLPGENETAIRSTLGDTAANTTPIRFAVSGLRFMGKGCAYVVNAPTLDRLRADLAARWADHLSRQDAQGFRPHVTIQNKTDPTRARALHDTLEAAFEPFEGTIGGLILQRYRAGPWDEAARFEFAGPART